jgi:hypothetical protein
MSNPTHPSAAELAARRTAAAAVLADFRTDLASAPLTSPPPMTTWALRLASVLGDVLAATTPIIAPAASHVRADRSAYLTPADLMTMLGALDDAVAWREHIGLHTKVPSYRALSRRLGDDR